MKKFIALFVFGFVVVNAIVSEGNPFEDKTYDELLAIQQTVNEAIWNKKEWKEVTVPAGIYEIGVDITVGKWIISSDSYVSIYSYDTYEKCVKGSMLNYDIQMVLKDETHECVLDLRPGIYLRISGTTKFKPFVSSFYFDK